MLRDARGSGGTSEGPEEPEFVGSPVDSERVFVTGNALAGY